MVLFKLVFTLSLLIAIYISPAPLPTPILISMFFKAIPFEVTSSVRLRTNFSNDVFRHTKRM